MATPDLRWDDLRLLEAIERTGSVRAAARETQSSLSTVYRRVAEFERQLGQLCLVRRDGDATLTAFGRSLAQVGKQVRGGLAQVFAELRTSQTSLEGTVSLTTVISLLPLLQAPLMKLTTEHPGLSVELHLGDSGPSVRKREVDVALAVAKRPPPSCWGRKVCSLDAGVFGKPSAVRRTPLRWVVRSLDEAASPESAWEREHVKDGAVLRAPFHALVDLCVAGAGVGLMPRRLAEHHGLVELEPRLPGLNQLTRPLWVLTHEDHRKSPRVLALCSALVDAFSDA
jgi:molybdate transport repressor ModE-like protein